MRPFYRYTALGLIATALVAGVATAQHRGGGDVGKMFERLDANGDGEITRAEADAARDARFAEADANGDGLLSAEELIDARAKSKSERAERRAARMIERLDTNGDGALSAEEMAARGEGRKGGDLFERADANGDGVITQEEAEEARAAFKDRRGGKKRGERKG